MPRATLPSSLHAALGSIVAATLAGCGDTPANDGFIRIESVDAETTASAIVRGRSDEVVCINHTPARTRGLAPDVEYDSIAFYQEVLAESRTSFEFTLREAAGEPCVSAADPESCRAEIEAVRLAAMGGDIPAAFPVPGSLLLATGVRGGNGASPNDPSVSIIDDVDALLAFLGRINTPNEAALVLSAHRGSAFQCILRRDGDDYTVSAIDYSGGLCPPTQQNIELRVTPDGAYSETPLGPPYLGTGCVGRRPDGLCATLLTGGDETPGDWLARTARLEAAAVAAFVLLAHELEALGAPRELLARLKRAARDEIAHTEQLTALARARGAEPAPAIVIPQLRRSPLELALENAVEGCVRECWGALCARFQAAAAQAPDVRAVFDGIAREEAEHAQLSRDIGAWLDAHLGPRDRACVAAARDQAIGDLRRELERDLAAPTRSELGLPSRAQALAALDALEGRGLLRAA